MDFVLQPWQLYLVILAGWMNRQQQIVIDYLMTENQVLRQTHGKRRILLSDDQRRRLAVQGKILGRKMLEEVGTLFSACRNIDVHKWARLQCRFNFFTIRPTHARTLAFFRVPLLYIFSDS